MNLIDFACASDEPDDDDAFVGQVGRVVDLDALKALDATQVRRLYELTAYLSDWLRLKLESFDAIGSHEGAPMIPYGGPFIENILTRTDGVEADFTPLETFGLGGED